MFVRDGFPGQRLQVLPRPTVDRALSTAPTSLLVTTDAGYFPHAVHHGRARRRGAPEAVIIVCTEGRGRCESGGTSLSIGPGAVLVIGPETPHRYLADDNDPWTIWWVHVAGRAVPTWMQALAAVESPVVISVADPARSVHCIADIVVTLENDASDAALLRTGSHAWALLTEIAANRLGGTYSQAEPVVMAQRHLRDHLGEQVRVPDLAALVGLSPSHFTTLFRAATGGGVVEYLSRLRMARARELLALTNRPIADIATNVGYTDAFYFSRVFRKVHGCTPSEFRRDIHERR